MFNVILIFVIAINNKRDFVIWIPCILISKSRRHIGDESFICHRHVKMSDCWMIQPKCIATVYIEIAKQFHCFSFLSKFLNKLLNKIVCVWNVWLWDIWKLTACGGKKVKIG